MFLRILRWGFFEGHEHLKNILKDSVAKAPTRDSSVMQGRDGVPNMRLLNTECEW